MFASASSGQSEEDILETIPLYKAHFQPQVQPTMQQPDLPRSDPREHQTYGQPSHAQDIPSQNTHMNLCGETWRKRKRTCDESPTSVTEGPTASSENRDQQCNSTHGSYTAKTGPKAVMLEMQSCLPREDEVRTAKKLKKCYDQENVSCVPREQPTMHQESIRHTDSQATLRLLLPSPHR